MSNLKTHLEQVSDKKITQDDMFNESEYSRLDEQYISLDKQLLRRTQNLKWIPKAYYRRGGKLSYGEWCHVIGIFQTLICLHLAKPVDNHFLDIGCGVGLAGIACEPYLGINGSSTGIDVSQEKIKYCQIHYQDPRFKFIHLNANNRNYAPQQKNQQVPWPLDDGQIDMVTAISVWTHFNEEDAHFYFKEISRVLKKNGKAIITFFVLDSVYEQFKNQFNEQYAGHNSDLKKLIFSKATSDSGYWLKPDWDKPAERCVAITVEGIGQLCGQAGLKLIDYRPGNWKGCPGLYYQDVVIFEKK